MNEAVLDYDTKEKEWVLSAPPHIVMRAKRVFGRLKGTVTKALRMRDTPEVARDLQWFIGRYPVIRVSDAPRLEARATEQRIREETFDRILNSGEAPCQFELALPARDYQRQAAQALLASGQLLLADDLGLGKTLSAICTLTDPRTRPALIVTLTHLPKQWAREIERFAPKLRTHIIKKGTPYDFTKTSRGRQLSLPEVPDVLIMNYHKLGGWVDVLDGKINSVIFDECQELRSGYGGKEMPIKYASAKRLAHNAKFRMGLSATPIYNYGGEFFSVLDVLMPDALGTRAEFMTEWCTDGGNDKPKIKEPAAFGSYIRAEGLVLRRTRAEVARELPALSRCSHHVEADSKVLDDVEGACAELARIILSQGEGHKGQKMMASEELSNKLRQATGIAKAPHVADFVRMILETEQKVVVFAWHREVYSILMDRLREFAPTMYTGSESPSQKEQSRESFINGNSRVLLMSLRAGAGLDGLQDVCRTAVFAELDWAAGAMEQCGGRIHRDGQKHPVVLYYLIAEEGSDPIVSDVLGVKYVQVEKTRDPDADSFIRVDHDESNIKRLATEYLLRTKK